MDTVGVEDYGPIKGIANDSDALQESFKNYDEDPLIQEHAKSGDWLFGRGMLDMKSGDAVNIATLFYYMEHPDELPCNLLFMTNCVEENDHTGAIRPQVNCYVFVKQVMSFKQRLIRILFLLHMTVMRRNIFTRALLGKC